MPAAERVRVREIDDDEGQRLLRIIRRGSGSVVTWRRAPLVLVSAQGISVVEIAEVAFQLASGMRTGDRAAAPCSGAVLAPGDLFTGSFGTISR
ncbi:hypothetical protein SACT1_0197 [Streptomyces sp. ACT-1]|nr:hypothetical protein [Streptomyces sp. ACT-1]EGE39606.1 hypothetical protein SACT1_0197 [Streptomyces sp. ACT-1]